MQQKYFNITLSAPFQQPLHGFRSEEGFLQHDKPKDTERSVRGTVQKALIDLDGRWADCKVVPGSIQEIFWQRFHENTCSH